VRVDSKTLLTRSVAYSYTNLRSASVRNSVSEQSNTAHPHCFSHSNYMLTTGCILRTEKLIFWII